MALVTPLFLPTKTYPFQRLRDMLAELGLQEGVYGATDMKASQRAAGADRSVDVAAGAALITGDDTSRQGAYKHYNDGAVNVAATANTSGTDRVDTLVLQNYDSSILGSSDVPQFMILAGTPSAGCQVSNPGAANYRAGAAALPNTAIRIAEWVATAGYTQITTAMIVDRRPMARGAFSVSRSPQTTNYASSSATPVAIDSTALAPRIECSGAPLRCTFRFFLISPGANYATIDFRLDGANPDTSQSWGRQQPSNSEGRVLSWDIAAPATGSHVVAPYWSNNGSVGITRDTAGYPPQFTVEEVVRPNTNNS